MLKGNLSIKRIEVNKLNKKNTGSKDLDLYFVINIESKTCLKKDKNYLQSKKFILDYKKPKSILIPPTYANAH